MIDYKWSSYPVYAYGQKGPAWLSTEVIWSNFKGADKHKQYREKVQKYAEEEKRLPEDIHHGMILGAKKFINKIRKEFLPDIPHNFLWNRGLMTNEQLGRHFNISHSAVSHSVKIFKEKMLNDKEVKNQFDKFNSQFKI